MPRFRYEVKKSPTEKMAGVMEAESAQAVAAQLSKQGYFPISISEDKKASESVGPRIPFLRTIHQKDVNVFFRQLANLTYSGLPLLRSLHTLVTQTENPKMGDVIQQIERDVQRGGTLAEALTEHPKVFPALYSSMVRAGETGGNLEDVLMRLATLGEKESQLRGKVVTAMIYPCFLLAAGFAAVFILLSFVFPTFIEFFNEYGAVLPLPTRILMGICGFMKSYWMFVLLGIILSVVAVQRYARSETGKEKFDLFVLGLPLFGKVALRVEVSKFSRTLGTLTDNGIPILNALKITKDTLGNTVIGEEVESVRLCVTDGESLSDALNRTEHFPLMMVNMMAVGEQGGRLGEAAKRVADVYDEEVERALVAMTSMLEPVLILVMGVFVGFLVVSMLLPIFQMSTMIS